MDGLRKDEVDAAIEGVCAYFDEKGLTLGERWFVCDCIEKAAAAILGEGFADAYARLAPQGGDEREKRDDSHGDER